MLMKVNPAAPEPPLVAAAVACLRRGGLVAYPTDTLYGLGVDALNAEAVERLYALKGRPAGQAVPLLVSDETMLRVLVAEVPPGAARLMARFWPGVLTLVFRPQPTLPAALLGESGGVGVRVAAHPVAAGLVRGLASPLTATSANPAGALPALSAEMVQEYFGAKVDLILDGGPSPIGQGSTVLDVTVDPPRLVREGVISRATLEAVIGPVNG